MFSLLSKIMILPTNLDINKNLEQIIIFASFQTFRNLEQIDVKNWWAGHCIQPWCRIRGQFNTFALHTTSKCFLQVGNITTTVNKQADGWANEWSISKDVYALSHHQT